MKNFPAWILTALSLVASPQSQVLASPVDNYAQLAKFAPPGDASFDQFGFAAAIDKGVAIIGSHLDDDRAADAGAAYVYDLATQQMILKLTANDANSSDQFGVSVDLDGELAVVGSWGVDGRGNNTGAAYVFDITSGQQLAKLAASDATAGDLFGNSVAISDGLVLVGASYEEGTAGAAYLFDVATGQQLFKFTAPNRASDEYFGHAVALDGGLALVGAFLDDDFGPYSGAAYVFDAATGQRVSTLTPSGEISGIELGISVAIDNGIALVGAYFDDNTIGAAYLFDALTGQQLAKLTPADGQRQDYFGNSVAIANGLALVGSQLHDQNGSQSGAAYLFDVATGQQLFKFTASDGASFDTFGASVALGGGFALIGAPLDDHHGVNSGSAYLFRVVPEPGTPLLVMLAVVGLMCVGGRRCAARSAK